MSCKPQPGTERGLRPVADAWAEFANRRGSADLRSNGFVRRQALG